MCGIILEVAAATPAPGSGNFQNNSTPQLFAERTLNYLGCHGRTARIRVGARRTAIFHAVLDVRHWKLSSHRARCRIRNITN
jgi:hypothetical protein